MFKTHPEVCLEELVPQDNFYRQVEGCFDLDFVRDLVCDLYSDTGRPSIDPVVFFKLQPIAFFEGIRSERQLMETVNMRLDHRWYIGYDLGEPARRPNAVPLPGFSASGRCSSPADIADRNDADLRCQLTISSKKELRREK